MRMPDAWVPVDPIKHGMMPEWMKPDAERNWRKAMSKTEKISMTRQEASLLGVMAKKERAAARQAYQYMHIPAVCEYLRAHNLTHREVAARIGTTQSVVSAFLRKASTINDAKFEALMALIKPHVALQKSVSPDMADAHALLDYAVQLEDRLHNLTMIVNQLSDDHAKTVSRVDDLVTQQGFLERRFGTVNDRIARLWEQVFHKAEPATREPGVLARLANWARNL